MRSSSIIAGGLRWLKPGQEYPLQLFILKGYETINFAAAYGSHAATGYGPNNFDFDLYQRLLPVPVADWYPEVANDRCAPPHYTEYFSGWFPGYNDVVSDSVLPQVLIAPNEIIQWLIHEMTSLKLGARRYDGLFNDASRLVQLGYRLLRIAGRRYQINSPPFAAALCMVGLGSIYYFSLEKVCPNCYRIASSLSGRCNKHSQSKHAYLNSSSRSLNSQAARTGRRVISKLGWDKHIPINLLPRWIASEWRTAGMLWPLQGKSHTIWNKLVAEALIHAPLIHKLLPHNFLDLSNKIQLELLRAVLDENEWEIGQWPMKIKSAQVWFETEGIVAPGAINKGFSDINSERIKQANALLDQGFKPAEIAKQLGITRSHLSQLWRRQKLRSVKELSIHSN